MYNGERYSHANNPYLHRCSETGQYRYKLSYDDMAVEFDLDDAYKILAAVVICSPYFDHYTLPEGNQKVLDAMETLLTRVGPTQGPLLACFRDDNDNLYTGFFSCRLMPAQPCGSTIFTCSLT